MNGAISAPRSEVRDTAPKIVSFEIPIDKIGEVIGPKGKVINTIQQETGADISVGDDGMVGTVSIGSKDGEKVEEAKRRIMLILDPPTAELGAIYKGRVVNITKFGAFVNVLPGRDGLVHISKLGGGKRIDRVEDVLSLGMELEVKVDDIDQSGKLSLSLVGDDNGSGGGGSGGGSNGGGGDRRGVPIAVSGPSAAARSASVRPERALPKPAPRAARLRRRRSRTSGKTRPRPSSVISDPRPKARVRGARAETPEAARVGAGRRAGAEPGHGEARRGLGVEGIRRSVLDSGLRVVTEALPELRSVTIGAWVGTGSRDETDGQSGASHFLEHLLFKGTPRPFGA